MFEQEDRWLRVLTYAIAALIGLLWLMLCYLLVTSVYCDFSGSDTRMCRRGERNLIIQGQRRPQT